MTTFHPPPDLAAAAAAQDDPMAAGREVVFRTGLGLLDIAGEQACLSWCAGALGSVTGLCAAAIGNARTAAMLRMVAGKLEAEPTWQLGADGASGSQH